MPHHQICSMSVSGGFLDGVDVQFAPGLNCIIGGRGTGKTTLLESIRHVFGLEGLSEAERKKREAHIAATLEKGGKVGLGVRTAEGRRFAIERPLGQEAVFTDGDGVSVPPTIARDQLFGIDIFSQNEIEGIALDPEAQLQLMDRFESGRIGAVEGEIDDLRERIRASARRLSDLQTRMAGLADVPGELNAITQRIAEMGEVTGANADAIEAANAASQQRAHEAAFFEKMPEAVAEAVRDLNRCWGEHERRLGRLREAAPAEGENSEILDKAHEGLSVWMEIQEQALTDAAAEAEKMTEWLAGQHADLESRHAAQEKHRRELIATNDKEKKRAAERDQALEMQRQLQDKARELDDLQGQLAAQERTHADLIHQLRERQQARSALRQEIVVRLNAELAPAIRIRLHEREDIGPFREALKAALKGSHMKGYRIDRIVEAVPPQDLARYIRKGDLARLQDQGDLDSDNAAKLQAHLQDAEVLAGIEAVDTDDRPVIELKHGESYKASTELSTGQRCTVILPILMLDSERPLLIDQPEDNLDNAYVFATVVQNVLRAKASRQLILITHNPNIPVLGDADRVFVFASDGARGRIKQIGDVEAVKTEIEELLEGGSEAFRERMKRYGHAPAHANGTRELADA